MPLYSVSISAALVHDFRGLGEVGMSVLSACSRQRDLCSPVDTSAVGGAVNGRVHIRRDTHGFRRYESQAAGMRAVRHRWALRPLRYGFSR